VSAGDTAGNSAVVASVNLCHEWIHSLQASRAAHVNLVPIDCRSKKRAALRLNRHLTNIQLRFNWQQTQTTLRSAFLGAVRIGNSAAEHLITTANSQAPTAALERLGEQRLEPGVQKPSQVGNRVLRPGNDDEIERAGCCRPSQVTQRDSRNRIES